MSFGRSRKGLVAEQLASGEREFAEIRGTPDVPNSGSNYNTTKHITIINPNLPLTMAVDPAATPKPAAAAASHVKKHV